MKLQNTAEVRSWVVNVECTITKQVVCDGCSKEEARSNLWKYSVDERETGMSDREVKSVEPNI